MYWTMMEVERKFIDIMEWRARICSYETHVSYISLCHGSESRVIVCVPRIKPHAQISYPSNATPQKLMDVAKILF